MKTFNFSAALLTAGVLMVAPAFAQTTPPKKQPTQEGGPSMPGPNGNNGYKQPTQESGPSMPGPNANLGYKQPTQEGGPSMPGPDANENGFKQRTQSLVPPTNEDAMAKGKSK